MWLSPEQGRVLPLSDKYIEYAVQVAQQLEAEGLEDPFGDAGRPWKR